MPYTLLLLTKKATLKVDDPFPQVAPLHPAICALTDTRHHACLLMYRHDLIESSPKPQDLCMYYPHFPVIGGSEKVTSPHSLLVAGERLRAFQKELISNSSPRSLTPRQCLVPHLTELGLE